MSIYDLKLRTRSGDDFDLSKLKGKVLLIVNTATGCGFTPQYEGLEKLYEKISTTCKNPGDIKWNFTKFLVDKDGNAIKRYDSTFKPLDMESKIVKLLDGSIGGR